MNTTQSLRHIIEDFGRIEFRVLRVVQELRQAGYRRQCDGLVAIGQSFKQQLDKGQEE